MDPNYVKKLSEADRLKRICQLAGQLGDGLDRRNGTDLRVSKEEDAQIKTMMIRALACPWPKPH